MVIGNGLLANTFAGYKQNKKICIFASGVSNPQNKDPFSFRRELDLLDQTLHEHPEKTLVYFSTCSVYDRTLRDSDYVKHKIYTENFIKKSGNTFIIFRISNPIGFSKNPYTVLNYLVNKIRNNEEFTLWLNAARNFIDTEDVLKIASYIIDHENDEIKIINIANTENIRIIDVIPLIEKVFGKKAMYHIEKIGGAPMINLDDIQNIIAKYDIQFDENYVYRLLQKYYCT